MNFLATQNKKFLQEAQVCLNRTQEHKSQTADNSKYTIFYLVKDFEGLYLECYQNPKKLLTLKIILKIVLQETHVCLNHAQEHRHLLIVSIKKGK